MLLMLIIASSCGINRYQPVQNEERIILNKLKEQAQDVEFEEIQG